MGLLRYQRYFARCNHVVKPKRPIIVTQEFENFGRRVLGVSLRTADFSPRESSLSGDERGETSAVRRLTECITGDRRRS